MIGNFYNVCKLLDERLEEIVGKINKKFVKKCYDLFEYNFKFLIEVL
jgi:hypothetical protein